MTQSNVALEILKQSPSLAGGPVVAISADTSYDDLMVLHANQKLQGQSIWVVFGEDQKLFVGKQEAKQQSLSALLPEGFQQTHFAFYRQRLGDSRADFPSVDGKRTVWIPVDGFFGGAWHDGPLVVTDKGGAISSLIPTGAEATLLLAGDDIEAIGIDKNDALNAEGSSQQILYRGCIAATRRMLQVWTTVPLSVSIIDASLTTLVQLAVLRAAMAPDQRLAVQITSAGSGQPLSKVDPRLRRFCEHTGTGLDSWSDPSFDLETFFAWMSPRWSNDLLTVINRHGSVIPG